LPVRPTVHKAVFPAVTPESATDFLGFGAAVFAGASFMLGNLLRKAATRALLTVSA
jgi:hypothetical protein